MVQIHHLWGTSNRQIPRVCPEGVIEASNQSALNLHVAFNNDNYYHWLFRNNNYLLLIPIRNAYRYVPLRKLPYSEPYFLKREHLYLNLQRNYS